MKVVGILAAAMLLCAHGEVITEAPEADLPVGSTAEPPDAVAKQAAETTTTEAPAATAAAVEIGICGYDVSSASAADLQATTDAAVAAMTANSDLDASEILDASTVDDPDAVCEGRRRQSGAAKTVIVLLPTADVDAIVASATPLTFDATIGGTTVSVTSTPSSAEVTIDPTLEGKAFCCTQVCVGGGKKGKKDKAGKESKKGKGGKKGKKGKAAVTTTAATGLAPVTATCDCSVCPVSAKKGKKDKKGKKSKLGQMREMASAHVATGVVGFAAVLGLVAGVAVSVHRRTSRYDLLISDAEVEVTEATESAPLIADGEVDRYSQPSN